MSQRTASGWVLAAVAAAVAGACGCIGPAALSDDPLRGGRPAPIAKASGNLTAGNDDPVPMPSSDMARSPAALTNAANPAPPRKGASPAPAARDNATFEQLQQQLQDYGVTWQMLKTNGPNGPWTFTCAIPDPATPGIEREFKAQAVGPNGLAAIRAALAEIEADRREHGPQ